MTFSGEFNGLTIPTAPSPKTVLLVEDNLADAVMLSTLFKERAPAIKVNVVHDGEAAIDYLWNRAPFTTSPSPDVVILDLNLPRKSGFEVLAETRAEPKLRDLPVFLLTTSSSPEDRDRAQALGVIDFLTKPAEFDELEQLIGQLVNVQFPKLFNPRAGKDGSENMEGKASLPTLGGEVTSEAFRLLIEAVKDYAIFMLDPHGYILTWNEGARRTEQYEPSEILGKHFSIFYTQEDIHAGHPEHELRVAEKEGRYEEEGWRLRKDGGRFWSSVTITAIRDATGVLIGFGKVTRDMTDRKLADERLRESEQRFRILVEGVRDYAIFMLTPDGNIVSWNKGAERIKGYKSAEVLGKHVSIFYTPTACAQRLPERELELACEKGSYEEEGIRVRKDGSTFWANVVITPLYDASGHLNGFAKVTRDVSEKKRAEHNIQELNRDLERRVAERTRDLEESKAQLLEQKEQLFRSHSDLQQFAYVASHDLQEPLRMVISQLQFLTRRSADKLDEESREFIDFAIAGARRMRSLVNDLLTYARIEKASDTSHEIDFNKAVADAKMNLENEFKETDTLLRIDPLPTLRADFFQIVQVFQALIHNALSFRAFDRRLTIHIGVRDTGATWTFFVQDNGIGIPPEYWQKIFVIFQRLHSDRDKHPGTGVGLAIARRIIERHRGRIWVDSEPGKGSTFSFAIPKG